MKKPATKKPAKNYNANDAFYVDAAPQVASLKLDFPTARRIIGCVIGAAVGDAVGYQVEFTRVADQNDPRAVNDMGAGGLYSDDTQMTEAALKAILTTPRNAATDWIMGAIRERFLYWAEAPIGGHRAPGGECMAGCRRLRNTATPWYEGGVEPGPKSGGGCGGPMKAHAFIAYMADTPRAVALAAEHSKLTHRHPIALGACAAMAAGVIALAKGDALWSGLMAEAAAVYSPEVARAIVDAQEAAFHSMNPESLGYQPRAFYAQNEGWDALTAVAAAVYCAIRNTRAGGSFRAGILEGANTPGDSDSIASMAGALLGAHYGIDGIPTEWVAGLERSDQFMVLARGTAAFATSGMTYDESMGVW